MWFVFLLAFVLGVLAGGTLSTWFFLTGWRQQARGNETAEETITRLIPSVYQEVRRPPKENT